MRKTIYKAVVALALIVVAVGITHIWKYKLVDKTTSDGSITVTLKDLSGRLEEREVPFKDGDYLIDCLEREFDNVVYEMGQFGATIYSISYIDTDFKTTYIAIYIDDKYASVGASYIALIDGMSVKLTETRI